MPGSNEATPIDDGPARDARLGDVRSDGAQLDQATLAAECRGALHRVVAAAKPREAEWLGLDLTMGQLKALFVLTTQGPRSVGTLGRALAIGEPAASLLVDKLEERGLAGRRDDLEDRRRTLVVPTEEATALIVRLRRSRDGQISGWLALMGTDDLDHLRRGLAALLSAIEGTDAAKTSQ